MKSLKSAQKNRSSKTPQESEVISRKLVMPDSINTGGSLFGGTMMAWIDKVGAMVAQRHSESQVVTASIDHLAFLAPVYQGDHVLLQGRVTHVGRSSMEIMVEVWKENPIEKLRLPSTKAFLTFVALDEKGKPKTVPELTLQTKAEKALFNNAEKRIQMRKELARYLEESMAGT